MYTSHNHNEIYDIGTVILKKHCFATKLLFSFCKLINPKHFKTQGLYYNLAALKDDLEHFDQHLHATLDSQFFKIEKRTLLTMNVYNEYIQ